MSYLTALSQTRGGYSQFDYFRVLTAIVSSKFDVSSVSPVKWYSDCVVGRVAAVVVVGFHAHGSSVVDGRSVDGFQVDGVSSVTDSEAVVVTVVAAVVVVVGLDVPTVGFVAGTADVISSLSVG